MPGQPDDQLTTGAAIAVLDPNTQPSNLIVDKDLEFSVGMEFTVSGVSKTLLGALSFEITYYYESIGAQPEGILGKVTGQTIAGVDTYNISSPAGSTTKYTVPPNTLAPGVYRLGAVVTFKVGPCPPTPIPWPVTGFTENPAIQVTD